MTELERALVALGNELEFPATPDLTPRVRERLGGRRRWLRPLVFAVALGLLAFGVAMAVPPARSAILRFFHIGSVTVERVETLPRAKPLPFSTGLGPPVSQPTVALPDELTAIRYYKRPGLAAAVLSYRGKQVLFVQLRGNQMGFAKKFVSEKTRVEDARIGEWGLWFEGGPHVVMWRYGNVHTRLAGNVLVWLSGDTTFRLEGQLTKAQMLALGRQITR
jgi:hypothetical protein